MPELAPGVLRDPDALLASLPPATAAAIRLGQPGALRVRIDPGWPAREAMFKVHVALYLAGEPPLQLGWSCELAVGHDVRAVAEALGWGASWPADGGGIYYAAPAWRPAQ